MKITRLGLLITTIFAASVSASAQANRCNVITYKRDPATKKQAGPRIVIGEFEWKAAQPMTGVVNDQATGVFIAVRVERVTNPGRVQPRETLSIGISFVERPEDVYDEVGAAEAEAPYNEHWRQLSVSKNVKVADGLYTYYLRCEKGGTRVLRHIFW